MGNPSQSQFTQDSRTSGIINAMMPFARLRYLVAALCLSSVAAHAQTSRPVLMISIDGMKPEYITHADEHHLKIPTLRRFLREGAYADGVIGVTPTVTYPSHTTLVTGVEPAVHGIYNNQVFDPTRDFAGAWYWYNEDVRVATLWSAAHEKGIKTASVSWPVSVDAKGVDYLIPEYWRVSVGGTNPNPDDRHLMAAISRPVGMLPELERENGPYMAGNDTSVDGDRTRTKFSLAILREKKPGFMTIHLSSLDGSEHEHGPFSAEADETLEAIDGMVAQLIEAARANDPRTDIVIVSDHGFADSPHGVNLAIPFLEAGLITMGKSPMGTMHVTSWQAEPWAAGGMAPIMLHDPSDQAVREKVKTILDKLAADPNSGVERILTQEEAKKYGGFPDGAWLVVLKMGYITGGQLSGPLVSDSPEKGAHGWINDDPEMHASFFAMGDGIAHGKDLGTIDMRRIAPTVAGILGATLPDAKQPKLDVAGK
ncbi:alkaline phosphatase family protein [Silvibacterium dinghuense]|uniref:Alkaline phosphatase family protein n=1 Tax=Silvibacterium dinghuense TaxID=1560006 RepID=A0A4Q1SJN0_9BACT|nr:ectonucleotide pyrophosphatase/phosphodiesterase [Silvibacterium dinghuense]RXS97635.1 alkaline phosphatase family protein [Silvibacterium dinghuense]GGH00723.1 alkaline phosphatase family protein [Silvibacterium dinghuense]